MKGRFGGHGGGEPSAAQITFARIAGTCSAAAGHSLARGPAMLRTVGLNRSSHFRIVRQSWFKWFEVFAWFAGSKGFAWIVRPARLVWVARYIKTAGPVGPVELVEIVELIVSVGAVGSALIVGSVELVRTVGPGVSVVVAEIVWFVVFVRSRESARSAVLFMKAKLATIKGLFISWQHFMVRSVPLEWLRSVRISVASESLTFRRVRCWYAGDEASIIM